MDMQFAPSPITRDTGSSVHVLRKAQHQRDTRQDNRQLEKKEKITHKCCKEAVHFSCAICFFINTAALSAVNTLWITLFLFARQCSETASGACLQSNRLFFLFLCFVSFLSDCRQGWRMSATSSRTEVCHVLMLVCSGTCENCHFSFQSQHLKSLKTCRREQKKKNHLWPEYSEISAKYYFKTEQKKLQSWRRRLLLFIKNRYRKMRMKRRNHVVFIFLVSRACSFVS